MNVPSFKVNHDTLKRGVYVSRIDTVGNSYLTTFDIRIKVPNKEPVLGNPEIHTLEHLLATYLRSDESKWSNEVIYIGPMGCRTGMYLILKGKLNVEDILDLLKNALLYIINFDKEIPANTSKECGNYLDHNLTFAKYEAKKFYEEVLNI